MKVEPQQIPPEGLELSEACDPRSLALETEDIKFSSKLSLHCRFTKDDSDIFCRGTFEAKISLICSRCGSEFTTNLEGSFSLDYPGKGNEATLDVTDDIRQEVLLGYPMKALCRPDCKGLCRLCGQNLNERDCGHKVKPLERPLSQLKDLLKKKGKMTK